MVRLRALHGGMRGNRRPGVVPTASQVVSRHASVSSRTTRRAARPRSAQRGRPTIPACRVGKPFASRPIGRVTPGLARAARPVRRSADRPVEGQPGGQRSVALRETEFASTSANVAQHRCAERIDEATSDRRDRWFRDNASADVEAASRNFGPTETRSGRSSSPR